MDILPIIELENKLRSLMKGEYSSLHLSFNDHACNYVSVETWLNEYCPQDREDFISEEELQKAIDSNRVWTLQWYPDTPVGSYCIRAASLLALVKYIHENN